VCASTLRLRLTVVNSKLTTVVEVTLAERITKWRESRGWSVRELARRMDLSASAVSDWGKGDNAFSNANFLRLCDLLGVTEAEFYGDIPAPTDSEAQAS